MIQGKDPASLPLRDIHLPGSVSWWPLAPGWWLLIATTLLTVVLIYWLRKRHRARRQSVAYVARQEMQRIREQFNQNTDLQLLARELSELLRRIAISVFPREDTASLTGEDWLRFLDRYASGTVFTRGAGRVLIEAPYQAQPEFDEQQLMSLVEDWMLSVTRKKPGAQDD